jgi:hypothetical protein
MYKDKEKQKEANRLASQKRRAKTKGMTNQGMTEEGMTNNVIPGSDASVIPKIQAAPEFSIPNFGQPDCECHHCRNNRKSGSKKVLNHGPYKTAGELAENELNRVALPGDVDYVPEPARRSNPDGVVCT